APIRLLITTLLGSLAMLAAGCQESSPQSAPAVPEVLRPSNQRRFASAQEAADALGAACAANDRSALVAIAGAEYRELMESGDDPAGRVARENFAAAAREQLKLLP